jgi:protein-S-isoprenylcysteine O-methyltransferase Ste14
MSKLALRLTLTITILTIVMAALIFLSAGTLQFWQGWTFLGIFTLTSIVSTIYLYFRNPDLLERRSKGGPTEEKRPVQKLIQSLTVVGFFALLVVPALDLRFGWSHSGIALVVAGNLLDILGTVIILRVYHENSFAAATVDTFEGQRVISTGPYAIVRHPMYFGGLFYFFGIPLALGSWYGLIPFALLLPAMLWRMFDEERMLAESLPGYREYMAKVKRHLIPYVW